MYEHTKEVIDTLLKDGIDARDKNGKTPLMLAAWIGDIELVKQLLAQGADVHLEDDSHTALDYAARQNNPAVLELIIKAGADLNHKGRSGYQQTALFIPAEVGRPEFLGILLQSGCNPDLTDKYKMTALQWAAQQGKPESIKILLAYQAAVNTKNHKGVTPLMSACISGKAESVELLLSAGASVNETAKDGYTALMYAAYYGHAEIAGLLLRHGADPDNTSKKGETALSIAEKKKFAAVAELLRP